MLKYSKNMVYSSETLVKDTEYCVIFYGNINSKENGKENSWTQKIGRE